MLSEEKQLKLREKIAEWGEAENIPVNIQERVLRLGVENPTNDDDLRTICDTELWSYVTIDWYMKFVHYLETAQVKDKPDTVTEEATVIRDTIVALQRALEVLEARNG